jgi:hypothetical protein
MAENPNRSQLQTTLAYMAVGVIGVSIISMLITLLAALVGISNLPTFLAQLPLIGLPIGFVLIMILLISAIISRSKKNRS